MKIFESVSQWQSFRAGLGTTTLGFVPTMGALHQGHLSLVERAKKENAMVLVSIFVNPTQFNNATDLQKYPRTIEADIRLLTESGCDYVLLPNEKEMYQDQYQFRVQELTDSQLLCGQFRPGHFEGVLTVVLKLLGLAQAAKVYMGEKDFQQLHLVQQMTKSFFLPTEVVACPIVREATGLAMSSRNERLSADGRKQAAQIYQALQTESSCEGVRAQLQKASFEVEYVEDHWNRRFVAAWLEGVRLIDNVEL